MIISIVIATMFLMIAYSSPVDNNINNINYNKNNNYVKINNITFMNNFNVSNNGIIKTNNINKTSINNIYAYKNNIKSNDNITNNITSYTSIHKNITKNNYMNYTSFNFDKNSNITHAMTFTEKFNDYKVQIADIIFKHNNENISDIYANIVPLNSSKILLGNEFTLNYKSSYNNEMKTLINSIELISFGYMNSNNNTLNKFGIEYSYIATAMNSMLGFTNNNIKNMQINGTESILIDYNWNCIYRVIELGMLSFLLALSIISLVIATGGMALIFVIASYVAFGFSGFFEMTGTINMILACGYVNPNIIIDGV